MIQALRSIQGPIISLMVSCLLVAGLVFLLGENPYVLLEAFGYTLFTSFGLGYTLFYTTPLIFTGLSVAVAFHCGLFNIGAEGQLYLGAIAVVFIATLFPGLPMPFSLLIAVVAASVAGGLWGAIAGYLKAKRGSHEVIVTILLNFIGISLVNYLILSPMRNPELQNPETYPVPGGYHLATLHRFFELFGLDWLRSTPANLTLFFALGLALICHYFLFYTTYGYELRAVGQSQRASQFAGISVSRNIILALFLAGALAGMVGINEVLGHQHKVLEGFSPQYGFTGIAVALLARNQPLAIVATAFLFGALHNSARELEFLSEVISKEVSLVLQATIIGVVGSYEAFQQILKKRPRLKGGPT